MIKLKNNTIDLKYSTNLGAMMNFLALSKGKMMRSISNILKKTISVMKSILKLVFKMILKIHILDSISGIFQIKNNIKLK